MLSHQVWIAGLKEETLEKYGTKMAQVVAVVHPQETEQASCPDETTGRGWEYQKGLALAKHVRKG